MCVDPFLHIPGEMFIGNGCVAEARLIGFRERDGFVNGAAWTLWCADDGNREMVVLNDDLSAFADAGENGMEIACGLGFGHVDLSHASIIAGCVFGVVEVSGDGQLH